MAKKEKSQRLDEIQLLKRILAIELFKLNVPQVEIGKRLQLDTHAVNDLLKGIEKELKS